MLILVFLLLPVAQIVFPSSFQVDTTRVALRWAWVLVLLLLILGMLSRDARLEQLGASAGPRRGWLPLTLGAILIVQGVQMVVSLGILQTGSSIASAHDHGLVARLDASESPWLWPEAFLGILLIPMIEEFICRGKAMDSFQAQVSRLVAGWFAFVLLHLPALIISQSVSLAVWVMVHGAVLGILRLRTGSWLPGWLYHAAWNGWGFIIMVA